MRRQPPKMQEVCVASGEVLALVYVNAMYEIATRRCLDRCGLGASTACFAWVPRSWMVCVWRRSCEVVRLGDEVTTLVSITEGTAEASSSIPSPIPQRSLVEDRPWQKTVLNHALALHE